ncbi:DUF4376 domain-containing protein [Campylobacter insulaenigrae]|uniref:DUF4376 domain-containing protein n=1 Tax=Campylobacter insulaenigrae NCTC 12927 TaxID=1031564 RepID=A0A0A8H174_9BACT|nr:DUF4376 domain-containing protein [Campylobacter insulaenigrae]AJC87791.1 hypothetical protein (DUF4376 domain) [Campylobacter insulaenigrae NCTC 12927]MCR6572981.1 DUF4376 domain-containing protein [Campylobacter insulaenigrae]MCR6577447.1 DUF4376 domain-containing protein [Campylobacter insulaenigrae]MCR6586535.1 DUF4376 domain-containing protein [Campylobacter insulaenigrae]VEH94128.1 Uncharacterised protein [Campylobacter insulaenigrae]
MFYKIDEEVFFNQNVYIKKVDLEGLEGEDTYFLDKLNDDELKALGFARVSEQELPSFDEKTQDLIREEGLDESSNTFHIRYRVQEKSLDALKEIKLDEIRAKRDEALESGIVYNEHTFQTSQKDKLNINGAVTNLMLDMQSRSGSIKEIVWIDIEDKKVIFTPQEFLQFAAAVAYNTQEITFKANALKEKVEQAISKEELEGVKWEI